MRDQAPAALLFSFFFLFMNGTTVPASTAETVWITREDGSIPVQATGGYLATTK